MSNFPARLRTLPLEWKQLTETKIQMRNNYGHESFIVLAPDNSEIRNFWGFNNCLHFSNCSATSH